MRLARATQDYGNRLVRATDARRRKPQARRPAPRGTGRGERPGLHLEQPPPEPEQHAAMSAAMAAPAPVAAPGPLPHAGAQDTDLAERLELRYGMSLFGVLDSDDIEALIAARAAWTPSRARKRAL